VCRAPCAGRARFEAWAVRQAPGVADKPFFKCAGTVQTLGDAGEDERDIAGAELARARGRVALSVAVSSRP
jgi:hypothetical protein